MRRSIIASLCASLLSVGLCVGCGDESSTTTAKAGHDGKSATGHSGANPAGGEDMTKNLAKLKKSGGPTGPAGAPPR